MACELAGLGAGRVCYNIRIAAAKPRTPMVDIGAPGYAICVSCSKAPASGSTSMPWPLG
jgi:hypothetical protein